MKNPKRETGDHSWESLYKVGGVTAIMAVAVGVLEIIITFLPGGGRTSPGSVTVANLYALFQDSWFLGLRNLGLLNIILTMAGIPTFLALFAAHRRVNKAYAALAVILYSIGVAVYIASYRGFALLALSEQYSGAATEVQKSLLLAAGEAMLAVGKSHSPGTFMGFLLTESAGILMSAVMLRGGIFSKATAYAGIVGFSSLLIFDICSSFVPSLFAVSIIFAAAGGLLSMVWYLLIARMLFLLGVEASERPAEPVAS